MQILTMREFLEVIVYTLAIIGVVVINCLLFFRTKKIPLVQYFFRIQTLIGMWMVAKIFRSIATQPDVLWFWILVEYFGICFFCVEFLAFAYIFRYNHSMPKKLHRLLIILTMVNFYMLFTNPFHKLFFRELTLDAVVRGPYFYVHMIYSYSLLAIGIVMLIHNNVQLVIHKRDKFYLVLGLLLPLVINLLYVLEWLKFPFDITPISFNIIVLSFGYIAFRNNFYDMQMMTRYRIFENLYEGVVILDKDNRIIEFNPKSLEIAYPITAIKKHANFETIFAKFAKYTPDFERIEKVYRAFIDSPIPHARDELTVLYGKKEYTYMFVMQKTYSKYGEFTGSIVKFVDMTQYHQLIHELEIKNTALRKMNETLNKNISINKRLVVEQERNRVSKELHDILGHSVTIVISLLEIVRQTYKKEPKSAREKIQQSMQITRNGLEELKISLTSKKVSSIDASQLVDDIETLTREFSLSGVKVELLTGKADIKLQPQYYDTIYRICQESLTNALRHGEATEVAMALRFLDEGVDIIIADNGKGCETLVKGNGLKGMEQRVNELNGFFSCGSPDGAGFNLHVTIPVERERSNINAVVEEDIK